MTFSWIPLNIVILAAPGLEGWQDCRRSTANSSPETDAAVNVGTTREASGVGFNCRF